MRDDRYFELFDTAQELTEYYSEQVGSLIQFGLDNSDELWVETARSGKEYFELFSTAEERIKLLYPSVFLDDDFSDPLAGF